MKRINGLLVLALAALLLYACGQKPYRLESGFHELRISDALADLEALQAPEGVDGRMFQELKSALAEALQKRTGKIVCIPPTGLKNTVNDFTIYSESGQMRLNWHYRNSGDYDQNGVVGVSDITPLAMHWQESAANPDSIQGVLDVDESGKVDTGDITPIAMNFGVTCAGYLLQNSTTGNAADFSAIQSFAMSTAVGAERKVFMPLVDGTAGVYYRVCPFDGAQVGPASNIVRYLGPPDPPVITSVTPSEGTTGVQYDFTAVLTGAVPITVSWDFGGGAIPAMPVGHIVTVTLDAPGEYTVNVWATNSVGTDNYQFILTVNNVPPEAPVITSVSPQSGLINSQVQFTADITGTPPLLFAWDFGNGATPNNPTDESPLVTLASAAGDYNASLTVTNAAGEDTFEFTLSLTDIPVGSVVVDALDGDFPSLEIVDGKPAIAYRRSANPPDPPNPTAFLVVSMDENGENWGTPSQAFPATGSFPGSNNRLSVVNGNPAICTSVGFMIEGGAVRYARASDPLGEEWAEPVEVWNRGMVNPPPFGFCVVDGYPAVAIPEDDFSGSGELLFYRALDEDGKDWPTDPVIAGPDAVTSSIASCDMKIVMTGTLEPRPAVLLSMHMDNTLFFLSSDMQGTAWEPPVKLESMSDSSALCVVQNYPAAVWRNGGELPRTLFYMRADDEKGAEWTNKVTLDSWITSSGRLGFAVISDRPAVAYANGDFSDRKLYYIIANDAAGKEWGELVEVHHAINVTENVALIEVNGRPAIAYCEYGLTNNQLRFIRAEDEFGYEWPE